MSDEPTFEETLAKLETAQKHSHRILRRSVWITGGAFLLLAVLNAAFFFQAPWVWMLRGLVAIIGLTSLAVPAHLNALTAIRALVDRDADMRERFTREEALMKMLNEVRPLLKAIEDAHAQGLTLMIPPTRQDGSPNGPTEHHSLH